MVNEETASGGGGGEGRRDSGAQYHKRRRSSHSLHYKYFVSPGKVDGWSSGVQDRWPQSAECQGQEDERRPQKGAGGLIDLPQNREVQDGAHPHHFAIERGLSTGVVSARRGERWVGGEISLEQRRYKIPKEGLRKEGGARMPINPKETYRLNPSLLRASAAAIPIDCGFELMSPSRSTWRSGNRYN